MLDEDQDEEDDVLPNRGLALIADTVTTHNTAQRAEPAQKCISGRRRLPRPSRSMKIRQVASQKIATNAIEKDGHQQ